MGEEQGERDKQTSALSAEPSAGLNPTTLRPWPERKSRVGRLTNRATQVPHVRSPLKEPSPVLTHFLKSTLYTHATCVFLLVADTHLQPVPTWESRPRGLLSKGHRRPCSELSCQKQLVFFWDLPVLIGLKQFLRKLQTIYVKKISCSKLFKKKSGM